jgi:hypothetical protein
MMYVMNTNIGGEPAQDARQVIIRATVKRYFVQVPKAVSLTESEKRNEER